MLAHATATVLDAIVPGGLVAGTPSVGWKASGTTRWIYVAAVLLLLAYAGSRFVFEVLLHRPPVA